MYVQIWNTKKKKKHFRHFAGGWGEIITFFLDYVIDKWAHSLKQVRFNLDEIFP